MALANSMAEKVQKMIDKINQATNSNSSTLMEAVDTIVEKYNEIALIIETIAGEPGNINNPINYKGNLILEANKYYTQDDQVYLCVKSSEVCVYHPLCELTEYVEKVKEIPLSF